MRQVLYEQYVSVFSLFFDSSVLLMFDLAHTPGGSSSGSAAAVAAGMASVAIGTQTVASVNRPAAYCGIAAYKPSSAQPVDVRHHATGPVLRYGRLLRLERG